MLSGRVLLVSSVILGSEDHMSENPIWLRPLDGFDHTDDQASLYLKPALPESHHGSDVEFDLLKTGQN